jgi:hypothetical protein
MHETQFSHECMYAHARNHIQKLTDHGNLQLQVYTHPFEKDSCKLYFTGRLTSKGISFKLYVPSTKFKKNNSMTSHCYPTCTSSHNKRFRRSLKDKKKRLRGEQLVDIYHFKSNTIN